MAKKMKKTMAMLLVLCMMASMLSVGAFAADGTVVENTTTTEFGVPTDVTTTTTTATDENGNVTVTVTVEKNADATDANGVAIKAEETRVETTVTDAEGNVIANDFVVDGEETKKWTEEIEIGEEVPEVNVTLVPGETTTGTATETVVETDETGTTTTTTIDREVTTETGEVEITTTQGDVTLDRVAPDVWEKAEGEFYSGYNADGTEKKDVGHSKNNASSFGTITWNSEEDKWDTVNWEDKGDYRYGGYGEKSSVGVIYYNNVSYVVDENDQLVLDENGNPILAEGYAASTNPVQFALHDENGNLVYAYCVDLETYTTNKSYYNVSNLEDSDYYASEESEAHIRAIVTNGYWGSSNTADEDGNYETGSLAKIKDDLKKAFEDGSLVDEEITDDDGNTIMLSELMQTLTEGEAMTATQAAIWSYANGSGNVISGEATRLVAGAEGFSGGNATRLKTFYNYLIALTTEERTESIVIDDTSFLAEDGLDLVVGDKIGEVESTDGDGNVVTNGVYDTALNFTLAFIPGENDDLLVKVVYVDLDGKEVTIIKRLAGENAEGEDHETLLPDEDGSYTIKGLALSENEEFNFDLKLQGTQYLEQGVYVYSPVGGRKASQTMVGLAEGNRSVDVSMNVTVKFSVDEEKNVVAKRVWHDEADPEVAPTHGVFALAVHRPLENIPEEEVPLADAPQTGDEAIVFAALTLLAGISLMAMHVSEKKRKEEV